MKQQRLYLWFCIIALVSLTLACSETATLTPSAYSAPAATAWHTPAAPVVTSAALQPLVEAGQVNLFYNEIQAREAERVAQSTLAAVHAQQTATATWAAVTATARADYATATAETRSIEATATAFWLTVEAERAQATATAVTAATATAEARAAAGATATAETQLFALELRERALSVDATATVSAGIISATQRIRDEQVRQAQLDTRAAELTYPVRAYGPWLLAAGLFGVILWLIIRIGQVEMRRRSIIPRDARGDMPLVLVPQRGGGMGFYDSDLAGNPFTIVKPDGSVTSPQLLPPAIQARITDNDQRLNLVHRGLPGGQGTRFTPQQAAQLFPPPDTAAAYPGLPHVYLLRNLQQAVTTGLVPPQLARALEGDWQHALTAAEELTDE